MARWKALATLGAAMFTSTCRPTEDPPPTAGRIEDPPTVEFPTTNSHVELRSRATVGERQPLPEGVHASVTHEVVLLESLRRSDSSHWVVLDSISRQPIPSARVLTFEVTYDVPPVPAAEEWTEVFTDSSGRFPVARVSDAFPEVHIEVSAEGYMTRTLKLPVQTEVEVGHEVPLRPVTTLRCLAEVAPNRELLSIFVVPDQLIPSSARESDLKITTQWISHQAMGGWIITPSGSDKSFVIPQVPIGSRLQFIALLDGYQCVLSEDVVVQTTDRAATDPMTIHW